MGDEYWNEVWNAESYDQFGDAMAVTSSFNTPDEMEVGPNPTVSSFDIDWILRDDNELGSSSHHTSSNDSSPFHSFTSHSNSPTQESDSSPSLSHSLLRLLSSSYHTSSNDSSRFRSLTLPFYSFTSHGNSPTQDTDSSPHVHLSILHRNSPVQETDSAFPSRFECHECGKSFSTKNNCQRHRRNVHGSNSSSQFIESLPTSIQGVKESANLIPVLLKKQKRDCPYPTCKRKGKMGFSRPDNLIQHRRNVHNENIPKRQRQS